ncbi:ABC transporter permease [Methanothrix soehngenii]|jgi:peptide/nickel transport system permease protein|uniref:ABC transporter permease n=1 Tax=Methanothrix soehngenii TaxID=2223 RepID=UPI0031418D38
MSEFARRLRRPVLFGLLLLALFLLLAVFAPLIAPFDPWEPGRPFLPPSGTHPFGTNDIGQDIFSELIYSTRISLFVGFFAAFVSVAIGTLVGLFSGYLRGAADEVLMGTTDIVLIIPALPLMIILAAHTSPSIWNIIIVIGALWWTSTARVVRSRVLQLREMPFVEAARSLGAGDGYIVFKHILPNTLQVILAKFILAVAGAMLTEASLSFLGLGDPLQKSWGMMLNYAFSRGGFINGYWWWYLPPGICISLAVLSFVLIGFGLEEQDREEMDANRL